MGSQFSRSICRQSEFYGAEFFNEGKITSNKRFFNLRPANLRNAWVSIKPDWCLGLADSQFAMAHCVGSRV